MRRTLRKKRGGRKSQSHIKNKSRKSRSRERKEVLRSLGLTDKDWEDGKAQEKAHEERFAWQNDPAQIKAREERFAWQNDPAQIKAREERFARQNDPAQVKQRVIRNIRRGILPSEEELNILETDK